MLWRIRNLKITIQNIFNDTIEEYSNISDKGLIWDLCTIRFKEYSTNYCTNKARSKRSKIEPLEKAIAFIDHSIATKTHKGDNQEIKELRKTLKQKYDILMRDKVEGAQITSRMGRKGGT